VINQTTSGESSSTSEMLCSNLAKGIHAAAQPLAVLLASLSKGHTDRMTPDELRELTASSAVEVQRVCTLFSGLQQLIMAESIKPQLSPEPILPLLAYAVEGVDLVFQQNGITLSLVAPDTCPPVLINRGSTLQALSRVLLVVLELSAAQDLVEVSASSSTNAVQIVVRHLHLTVAGMNPEASLSLAIAEADMRSQQASLTLSLQPFTVRIDLPLAPPAY
jgi:hypothetical protein